MRLTAAENKAIEQRAVEVTRPYFDGLEYETKDVESTESYDIKATKDGQKIKIEVKRNDLRRLGRGLDFE
jgi:Domain of unknown function (DUF3883)